MSQITVREQEIKTGLVARQTMVNALFGDKEKAAKFLATATKVGSDIKLANCNLNSIIDACITVAQLGLDLSPVLSHAYLVPFKGSAQLIVSARGYMALLARTGWKVKTYIVNEGDFFDYQINGFEETIQFKKDLDGNGEFKYAVALAQSPDGVLYVEVMNASHIEKHRLVSSNQNGKASGVWAQWFEEMALKTVLKKLAKKLPIGEDIMTAVEVDDTVIEVEEIKKPIDLNSLVLKPKDKIEDININDISTKDIYINFLGERGLKGNEFIEFSNFAQVFTDEEETMIKFLEDVSGAEALIEKFFEDKEIVC